MKKKLYFTLMIMAFLLLSACNKEDASSESKFEAYYQEVTDEEVVCVDDTFYVDSQVLLSAQTDISKSEIEKLIKKDGGFVVGYISISNDYQIQFEDRKTYDELMSVINEWKNHDAIESVSLNYAVQMGEASIDYKKDPWIDADDPNDNSGSEWSETSPDGNNWWAEAIMMPSVWKQNLELQPMKVGIYDTMFDTENEDLQNAFVKIWNPQEDADRNCNVTELYNNDPNESIYYHGTHVAGLIAADAENGFGIAGVNENVQLYGFSYSSSTIDTEEISQWDDLFEMKYSIALMLNEGVKIINISAGNGELLVAAQHQAPNAVKTLKEISDSYEHFLKDCLDAGYDFLIIKSAGNENKNNWISCEVSEEHPFGYTIDNGVTDEMIYDSQYDFLGAITDETVKKHIVIVGAAENHSDYYTTSSFSTVGERVDVYAPGTSILSDLPDNITGMCDGTSMATPIVSGVASLVWGVNPDLSAEQVADIVCASTSVTLFDSESVSGLFNKVETTPIVNAYFAVQLALNTSGEGDDHTEETGIVSGMVYTEKSGRDIEALSGVSVSVVNEKGEQVQNMQTSNECGYTFVLPAGTYTIEAAMNDYETVSKKVTVEDQQVLNMDFKLNKLFKEKTEEELRAILEEQSADPVIYFEYDDYDGDGIHEAYGFTSPNKVDGYGQCSVVDVWYVDSAENCSMQLEGTSGYLHEEKLIAGNKKFVVWENYGMGSSSSSLIFGVKNGKSYIPEVWGQYMSFGYDIDTGEVDRDIFYGYTSDFSQGYHDYIPTAFVFDEDSGEFVKKD